MVPWLTLVPRERFTHGKNQMLRPRRLLKAQSSSQTIQFVLNLLMCFVLGSDKWSDIASRIIKTFKALLIAKD